MIASPDILGEVNFWLILYDPLYFIDCIEVVGQLDVQDGPACSIKHCGRDIISLKNCRCASIAILISRLKVDLSFKRIVCRFGSNNDSVRIALNYRDKASFMSNSLAKFDVQCVANSVLGINGVKFPGD